MNQGKHPVHCANISIWLNILSECLEFVILEIGVKQVNARTEVREIVFGLTKIHVLYTIRFYFGAMRICQIGLVISMYGIFFWVYL